MKWRGFFSPGISTYEFLSALYKLENPRPAGGISQSAANDRAKKALSYHQDDRIRLKKECVTRFSTSIFFHDSNPSGPLINSLKYF